MKLKAIAAALAGVLALGASALAQTPQEIRPVNSQAGAGRVTPPAPVTQSTSPSLNRQDLEAWLDGYMPYALASGDIPGAVVVVTQGDQVLLEKGYGYADVKSRRPVDPKATLFRIGSVSKLFTWTAVMQQVEAGKVDLDADVNRYLDFKIPPRNGQPVTMRQLMTHSAGFAESLKHILPPDVAHVQTLDKFLKNNIPPRVYDAGTVPAYSNYGAALAGYIVQRVSGEPFDDYITRHIMASLGMAHSTFAQPLPAALQAMLASGYPRGSLPPHPFELVGPWPAGSVTTSGDDMARFMIAHLNGGQYGSARILAPATEQLMQTRQKAFAPPLNPMGLGFRHEDRNGQVIVGHGGDTEMFHSDLHLLVGPKVGIFMSANSPGKEGAVQQIRADLLANFVDRYYPAPEQTLPTASTAKAHAQLMAGEYWSSRRVANGFFRVLNLLSQSKIVANPDGTIVDTDAKDESGAPYTWREVAPFVWKDASGKHTLAASVKDGKVTAYGVDDFATITVAQPVPVSARASWNLPLLSAMVVILLSTVALWPIQWLVRRRHGRTFPLSGLTAMLYRAVRLTALVDLVAIGGYFLVVTSGLKNLAMLDEPLDIWLRLLQLLCVLGVIGGLLSVWNAVRVWTEGGRSWWAKLSVTLIMVACLAFIWFVFSLQLVTPSLRY